MSAKKSVADDYNKPFPKTLRSLLEETNTTQLKLAEAIGIKRQTISSYTLGETLPDIETFKKISDYFQVTSDYLLGKTKNKTYENAEIGAIIGLSDEAIEILQSYTRDRYYGLLSLTSDIITHRLFERLVYLFQTLRYAVISLEHNGMIDELSKENEELYQSTIKTLKSLTLMEGKQFEMLSGLSEVVRYRYQELNDLLKFMFKELSGCTDEMLINGTFNKHHFYFEFNDDLEVD